MKLICTRRQTGYSGTMFILTQEEILGWSLRKFHTLKTWQIGKKEISDVSSTLRYFLGCLCDIKHVRFFVCFFNGLNGMCTIW